MDQLDFLCDRPENTDPGPGTPPWKILIVDDEPDIHRATRLALSAVTYRDRPLEFISAYSHREAREMFGDHDDIALAFIDVVMETDHAGLDLVHWVRRERNAETRIILRTGQPGQAPERDVIVNYEINDYKEKAELTAGKLFSCTIAGLRAYEDISLIKSLLSNISNSRVAAVQAMAMLCESRDTSLGSHVQRVSAMAGAIAAKLAETDPDIDQTFIDLVCLAATLHDTGKIAVPDDILNAPRPLTDREFAIIRRHPHSGKTILERALEYVGSDPLLETAMAIAFYHHEKWDGSGYPNGLRGLDIPLPARIVAVADVYDALRARRPYKPSLPIDTARAIIRKESGRHFDPAVVAAFLAVVDQVEPGFVYEQ